MKEPTQYPKATQTLFLESFKTHTEAVDILTNAGNNTNDGCNQCQACGVEHAGSPVHLNVKGVVKMIPYCVFPCCDGQNVFC